MFGKAFICIGFGKKKLENQGYGPNLQSDKGLALMGPILRYQGNIIKNHTTNLWYAILRDGFKVLAFHSSA